VIPRPDLGDFSLMAALLFAIRVPPWPRGTRGL
jgi:hypothetical protein